MQSQKELDTTQLVYSNAPLVWHICIMNIRQSSCQPLG